MTDRFKKLLLLNPAKDDAFVVRRLHMGLCILGGLAKSKGHEVRLVDYSFLRSIREKIGVPSVASLVAEFKPDVICISVFTYLFDEVESLIGEVARCTDVPVMLGGPHFAVFHDDFASDTRISYVVRGEAELIFVDLVEHASRQVKPKFIDCPTPLAEVIGAVDLSIAYGSSLLCDFQIQLSRGCPYSCTFCNVACVAGRKIRARSVEECVQQIISVKRSYPQIQTISITDDCPGYDNVRFRHFLSLFSNANLECSLWIDNVRANLLDRETIALYAAAGGKNLCLGVESGDPDVFGSVNKGESLDQIEAAARLIKNQGLALGMCFVIGLPHDNLSRHRRSMAFAQKLRADYIFWNMCIPWPRTKIYDWFVRHGEVGNPRNFSTLINPHGQFKVPVASSPDFPRDELIRAWLMANMITHRYFIYPKDLRHIFALAIKYRLYGPFVVYFLNTFLPALWEYLTFVSGGLIHKLRRYLGFVNGQRVL